MAIPPFRTPGTEGGASGGGFTVVVHGCIECAETTAAGLLYCRTSIVSGRDWRLQTSGTSGERADTTEVVTQMTERLPGPKPQFSWNSPFDFTMHSTNVHGWPQLAIGLTTIDSAMKNVTIAYARCHVPQRPGSVTLDLPLMQPVYTTPQHQLFGLFAPTPELRDMSFICRNDDRIVMTAKRLPGYIRVSFDVAMIGLTTLGYE